MSFRCAKHGWTHQFNQCPSCPLTSSSNGVVGSAREPSRNNHLGSDFNEWASANHEKLAKDHEELLKRHAALQIKLDIAIGALKRSAQFLSPTAAEALRAIERVGE